MTTKTAIVAALTAGLITTSALAQGDPSSASVGEDPGLPTMRASVNAFSRFWFGVRPASSLALTDQLAASPDLLGSLDEAVRLPRPAPGWAF